MMETIHSEAIANRTYSLTAYSTPKLRHTDYQTPRKQQRRRFRNDKSPSLLPPTPSVTLAASTTAADDDASTAAAVISATNAERCGDITQLRCRTNAMFTKFSCSYVSWSFSSTLTRLTQQPTTRHCPQSHRHFHPKHFSLSYSQRNWLLVPLVLLSLLSNHRLTMANPIHSPGASSSGGGNRHWMNPCNLNLKSVNSEESSSVNVDLLERFRGISKAAQMAHASAEQTKTQFVDDTFGDPDFMRDFEWLSYNWLPKIPSMSEHHFKNIDTSDLLRKSYEYMQHYAVAIDQMVMDQILYDGNYVDKFRDMEHVARSVLCPLHQAILELKIKPNRDVTKDIMSEEYRSIPSEVTRNVRDYIILRDFVAGLRYIHEAFLNKYKEVQKESEDDGT